MIKELIQEIPNSLIKSIVNPGEEAVTPVETFFILLETGDKLLQEIGDKFLLENAP